MEESDMPPFEDQVIPNAKCTCSEGHISGPLRLMSHRPPQGGFAIAGPAPFVVAEYPSGLPLGVCREQDGGLEGDIYRAESARRKRVGLRGWAPLLHPNGWVRLVPAPGVPTWRWGRNLGDTKCLPPSDRAAAVRASYGLNQDERDRAYTLARWSREPGFYVTRWVPRGGETWLDPVALIANQIRDCFEPGTDLLGVTRDEIETNTYGKRGDLAEILSDILIKTSSGPLWIDVRGVPLPEHKAVSWLAGAFKPIHGRAVIVSVPEDWRHPGIAERLWEYSRKK